MGARQISPMGRAADARRRAQLQRSTAARARTLAERPPVARESASSRRSLPRDRRRHRSRSWRGRAALGGYSASSPSAISARPECRATSGGAACRGRLGGDHPEGLREDRRHDRDVGEREQMDEVAVLERPGEERPGGRNRLELGPVVPKPTTRCARRARAARRAGRGRPFVEQLPEVDDGRLVAGEERGQPLGVAFVGQPLVRVAGVRRVAARLVEQRRERIVARLGRRTRRRRRRAGSRARVDVAARRLRAPRGCAPSRRTTRRAARAPPRPTPRARRCPRIEYSSSEPCAFTA